MLTARASEMFTAGTPEPAEVHQPLLARTVTKDHVQLAIECQPGAVYTNWTTLPLRYARLGVASSAS